MPSGDTFGIPQVAALLARYVPGVRSVDPFARASGLATLTNDLDPSQPTHHHMDALDFAQMLVSAGERFQLVLFDPPYSYRQVVELYAGFGRKWTQQDQQQVGRWSKLKNALTSILSPGGVVISFGWNSTGFGKRRGFTPIEYALINHGSAHNDTIVTVERLTDASTNHQS
jgi:hypothetical protein